jgi:hypothetical protein
VAGNSDAHSVNLVLAVEGHQVYFLVNRCTADDHSFGGDCRDQFHSKLVDHIASYHDTSILGSQGRLGTEINGA